MSRPQSAMVLAAGLGTRMRPLTDTRPKPLIEVGDKPLLGWALDHLEAVGIEHIVVNVHYRAQQIEEYLACRAHQGQILVSDERAQLLETGGGVANALPLLRGDSFLVINADNLWQDGSCQELEALIRQWDKDRMDALLLLAPRLRATGYDGAGDFFMQEKGELKRRGQSVSAPYVFSGIQILARSLFNNVKPEPFSLNRLYDEALARGRLYGAELQGRWFHVGTPEAVQITDQLLRQPVGAS